MRQDIIIYKYPLYTNWRDIIPLARRSSGQTEHEVVVAPATELGAVSRMTSWSAVHWGMSEIPPPQPPPRRFGGIVVDGLRLTRGRKNHHRNVSARCVCRRPIEKSRFLPDRNVTLAVDSPLAIRHHGLTQTVETSRKAGDALVNQGATFLVEQFRDVAREVTETMLTELRREIAKAERASRTSVRIACALGSLLAIAVAGLAGFLLAGFARG
jgi:hypothetical protein